MRGAYDAPRASMSPSTEGDHGRRGRLETDGGRVTIFVIRDSSISRPIYATHDQTHFYTQRITCPFQILLARYDRRDLNLFWFFCMKILISKPLFYLNQKLFTRQRKKMFVYIISKKVYLNFNTPYNNIFHKLINIYNSTLLNYIRMMMSENYYSRR